MRYEVSHVTTYDYEGPVLHGRHVVRQRPRALPYQEIERSEVTVSPEAVWTHQELDYFGNETDTLEVLGAHDQLVVTTTSQITVGPRALDLGLPLFGQSWEETRRLLATDARHYEAREYRHDSPLVRQHPALLTFAADTFTPKKPLLVAIQEFNHRIFEEFSYEPLATDVATPLARVLRERRGVCQDFAHVAVGALRSLGLAARYVSGYLETQPPEGKERLIGADASHAWASVYVPDFGWLDFDPTNDVLPGERHIVVAWGRDFSDVSPLKGVVHGGGRHVVTVGVDVNPCGPSRP
ncbi:MAG TPA: transglutaminase family protein [Polyangiaceae bacterium]|nr:transglutaminase family protein [Polyangiaceae bacterium]